MRVDVVVTSDADGLESDGFAPTVAELLVRALRCASLQPRLVELGLWPRPVGGVPTLRSPRAGTVQVGGLHPEQALRRLWRLDPPTIVHAHGRGAAAAALAAAAASTPVVVTLGPPPLGAHGALGGQSDGDLVEGAALVAASSRAECRRLLSSGGASPRIAYLPPAVDLQRHRAVAWRRRAQAPGPLLIGHVASSTPEGGTQDLLRALAETPRVTTLVVDPSGRHRRTIEPMVRSLGVGDRVRVAPDPGGRPSRSPLADCDVVVCCPHVEVTGLLALEALACGIPVVASRVGGLIDVVGHEATGLHVPPAAPGDLAAALRTLHAEPAQRQLYGLAARTRVRRHALDRVGLHARLAYEQVVARARRAATSSAPDRRLTPADRSTA
jgi:D-inositol-3-phosphate glycosyltransferase